MRSIHKFFLMLVGSTIIFLAVLTPTPLEAKNHAHSHPKKDAAVTASKSKITQTSSASAEQMMRMPLVLPLFVQDQHFTSTLVLVNGSVESTYADVVLTGPDGSEINHRRVEFSPHSQRRVEVTELLQGAASPATMGRITIAQSPHLKGLAIAAQLSMTYEGSSQPNYIDEETAMPSLDGSQILRGVADRATGFPIVAVTSLAASAQGLTVECLSETGLNSAMTVELGAGQTLLVQACEHRTGRELDFASIWTNDNRNPDRAVAIALTSDATPGSFAAFGLAPHKKGQDRYFSAVNFSDPKMIGSNTIFVGVPVGSPSTLPEGRYVPQLALANFSGQAVRVQVQYAKTMGEAPSAQDVRDMTLPPKSTKQVILDNLKGGAGLQNSFVITSSGAPGDLMAKLVSTSESALHEVEILGKDERSGNGGSHPWSLQQGNEATLLLFNPTTESHKFTVLVSGEGVLWEKVYELAGMQTEQISIRNVILENTVDDKGKTLPGDSQSGLVEWFSQTTGKGRLLESNRDLAMARNFSCTGYYCLCNASFSSGVTLFSATTTVDFGSVQGDICQSNNPGPCCNQGSVTQFNTTSYPYSWSSGNTSVIQISGSSTSQSVNTYGAAGGSTPVTGSICDPSTGCCISTSPPGNVCDFITSPSGNINAQTCDITQQNTQKFNFPLTLASPSSCAKNCPASSATFTGQPNYVDVLSQQFTCNSMIPTPYLTVTYATSGSHGQSAGTYSVSATMKYAQNDKGVTHKTSGNVICP